MAAHSAQRVRIRRRRCLVAVALLGPALLAACGDDGQGSSPAVVTTLAADGSSTTEAAFNDADVTFAQDMIVHHRQAIEMAEIALESDRGASADVSPLAADIQAAQDPEIEKMTEWLETWGRPVEREMQMSDEPDMASMPGMMSDEDIADLGDLSGPEFDQRWLNMMVAHHQGAIDMATQVTRDGVSVEVRGLASQIVNTQEAEVREMSALIDN